MMKTYIMILGLCLLSFSSYSQQLNNELGIKLPEEISQQGLDIGSQFPLKELTNINGTTFSADRFKNKIVVFNFWFVGCRGCKSEESYLKQITNHFSKNSDIEFISICTSPKSKIESYYKKHGEFGYQTSSMDRKKMNQEFKVISSPTHWIYVNGLLTEKIIGPINSIDNKDIIIEYLDNLAKTNSAQH